MFRRHFPQTKLVVLGQNRRSTTPILQCAFAVVDKNPPVFAASDALAYRRTPLQSAREDEAKKEGKTLATFPVEAISFAGRDAEAPDVAAIIEETRRRLRCRWKDFGVLYRSHIHRDDVVQQLAEREIPFSIENMDVSDTPEVRDLVCLRRGRGGSGIRCQPFSRSSVAAVRCRSGAASGGAACDCKGIERKMGS